MAMSMMLANSISKSPTVVRVVGILLILLFGTLGFVHWRELQSFPLELQHTSLSAASSLVAKQRVWAVIDDIKWDCSHIYYKEIDQSTYTDIVFTDKNNNLWGVATFSGKRTCDEVMHGEGVGVLDVANDKERNDLTTNGFDVARHETNGKFLSLCTYCGRDNSQALVISSVFMVIIGVSLVGTARKMQKKIGLSQSRAYISKHGSA